MSEQASPTLPQSPTAKAGDSWLKHGFLPASFFVVLLISMLWVPPSVTWLFNGTHLYLLPGLLAVFLLYHCLGKRAVISASSRQTYFLLILLVLLLANTILSQRHLVSLVTNLEFYSLIAALLIIRQQGPAFFRHFATLLLATCLLLGYLGMLMYLAWLSGYEGRTFLGLPWFPAERLNSMIGQPNLLATWMNIGLVLLLTRFRPDGPAQQLAPKEHLPPEGAASGLEPKPKTRPEPEPDLWALRLWGRGARVRYGAWFCGLAVLTFCLSYSYSRAGLLTFVVSQGLIMLYYARQKDFQGVKLGLVPVALLLWWLLIDALGLLGALTAARDLLTVPVGGDLGVFARFTMWGGAVLMFFDFFPLGAGGGAFALVNGPYLAEFAATARFLYEDILYTWWAHNDFLHYLAEYGLITLGLVALALVLAIRNFQARVLDLTAVVLVVAVSSMFCWQLHSLPLRYLALIALAGLCYPRWWATADVEPGGGAGSAVSVQPLRSAGSLARGLVVASSGLIAAVLLAATLYNGYFDRQAVALLQDLNRHGLSSAKIARLELIERANPYIYQHLNKWFVEASLRPGKSQYFGRMLRHGQNFYQFENSHLAKYAYAFLLTFNTSDAERDYQPIRAIIDQGIELKPDFENLWQLKHYLHWLRFAHRAGLSVEELRSHIDSGLNSDQDLDTEQLLPPLRPQ